jgi:hypothetical protein
MDSLKWKIVVRLDDRSCADIREETPVCYEVLFLGTAGSSLPPAPVREASFDFLEFETRVELTTRKED